MRWIIILCLLASCGGYRFTQQENPLSQYGIQSLSVPMFYNYSNMPEVSADFTRETYLLLSSYRGLKLNSGYSESSDAVLVGIIRSREKINETLKAKNLGVASTLTPNAVGDKRQPFYVPTSTELELSLQIIVIKKPTEEEMALLKSGIGDKLLTASSRVIFNEKIPLRVQYTQEILDSPGTQVIATQNAGIQRKTIKNLATEAAVSVRDMILYAF